MVDTPMPLTAHLSELRSRLIWCMVALAVGFIVCYGLSDKIVAALQSPVVLVGQPIKVPLQIIAPAEAFVTYIKVGLIAGLFLVLPFILYQLWKFVAPGLLEHEKKYTVPFLVGSAMLFYSGGVIFYLVLPFYHSFSSQFCQRGHQSPTVGRILCDVLCALNDRLWPGVSVAHGGSLPDTTGTGIIPPSRPIFSPCDSIDFCRGGGVDPYD